MQLPSAPDHCVGTDLSHLREDAASCRRCPLWRNATQTVFGEGPASARMMLVGEQPGDREDLAGRPFIGPAGQILDQALEAAGIDRGTVYITNAVKRARSRPAAGGSTRRSPRTPAPNGCSRGDGRRRADAASRHYRAGARASDRERVGALVDYGPPVLPPAAPRRAFAPTQICALRQRPGRR